MTDEQPQKKKKSGRKSDIGSIQQYATFGSEENEDTQLSQKSDSQISRHPEDQEDTQSSKELDSQISSNPESQMVHYSESELAGFSASQIAESQDKQMVSYLKDKKPERKAQIAYLPPGLIKRLKRFAFDHDLEISMVVQVAVQEFLDRKENEQVP
jgi:hypothetical protein